MPLDPARRCPCHGEPMFRDSIGWHRCPQKYRAKKRRYERTRVQVGGRVFYSAAHHQTIRALVAARRQAFLLTQRKGRDVTLA